MSCATSKKAPKVVIYPPQWLDRTGLEEQIFDDPFPGVGLRTEDLDVPTFSSFSASRPAPPTSGAESGLGAATPQPATIQYRRARLLERAVEFGSFCLALVAVVALLIAVTPL